MGAKSDLLKQVYVVQGNTPLHLALLRKHDACALAMLEATTAHEACVDIGLTNDKVFLADSIPERLLQPG